MNTLDKESATAEFYGMCDALSLDSEVTGEDAEDFSKSKDHIIKAIMRGALIIDEDSLPVYTTSKGDVLKISEPTGATLLSMDKIKAGQDMRKSYTILGELTGGKFVPSKCKMRDINVLSAIMSVFLAG
jgi:hypothetical protein